MARVMCRCGESLKVSRADPDRLTCPRCGAKVRIRRSAVADPPAATTGDGYIRFYCPCGRRLKVRLVERPEAGKCPDCGRIVPVPESAWHAATDFQGAGTKHQAGQPGAGARTEDMDATDLERLERWASRILAKSNHVEPSRGDASTTSHQALEVASAVEERAADPPPMVKMEAGLRVCPRCGKPLHMSATVCRSCGEPALKR
jgi:hypothetical protein